MRPLRIGICCYPTFGGSGVIATEMGLALATRGHRIHYITTGVPRRLNHCPSNVTLHEVGVRNYPMFNQAPYSLALASKLVSIAQWKNLDIIHGHYAIPYAASAIMAGEILGDKAPKIVSTLHGTDVSILGTDENYRPVIRWAVEKSDAVTTPSLWLRDEALNRLDMTESAEVIPNFVDVNHYSPQRRDRASIEALFVGHEDEALQPHHPILIHVSNFRPVKRVETVIDVFAKIDEEHSARLLLVGDGPQRSQIEAKVRRLGLEHRVRFLGKLRDFAHILSAADLFILPSESESFGLAALEAQACGVPVIASDVGGLPEVILHKATGLLTPLGDDQAMIAAINSLLNDTPRREEMKRRARERALELFQLEPIIDRYERLYRRLLAE